MIKKWTFNNIIFGYYQTPNRGTVCINLIVNVGSKHDKGKKGIAHFLEHMLIAPLHNNDSFRSKYRLLGTTNLEYTAYEIVCKNDIDIIYNAFLILKEILAGKYLSPDYMETVRIEIINEYEFQKNKNNLLIYDSILSHAGVPLFPPIGSRNSIEHLTFEELVLFYRTNYQVSPLYLSFVGAADYNIIEDLLLKFFSDQINKPCCQPKEESYNSDIFYRYIIHDLTYENLKIYIRTNTLGSIHQRVREDFAILVMDNLIDKYFMNTANLIVDVITSRTRLDSQYQFIFISINGIKGKKDWEYWLLNDKGNILSSLYNFISKKLIILFDQYLEEYRKYILSSQLPPICPLSDEVRNHLIYNEPIYNKHDYLECLCNLHIDEIQDMLSLWINQGEIINIGIPSSNT